MSPVRMKLTAAKKIYLVRSGPLPGLMSHGNEKKINVLPRLVLPGMEWRLSLFLQLGNTVVPNICLRSPIYE